MNTYNKFLLITLTASLSLLLASPAKADMKSAAIDTAEACAYVGVIGGAGAHVIMEKGAIKTALAGCALAGGAVAGYNYFAIPTNDSPSEKELNQPEPVSPVQPQDALE
ncbi:MAG: hypothetical protein ACXWQO_20220 [Bdellovibrionota bacterium]